MEDPLLKDQSQFINGRASTFANNAILLNGEALKHNFNLVSQFAPEDKVLAVVKSNSYGHGLAQMVGILDPLGANFGVATLQEALELRDLGVKRRILLLGGANWLDNIDALLDANVTPVVGTINEVDAILNFVGQNPKCFPFNIHLGFDSGMGRTGFLCGDEEVINTLAARLLRQSVIKVEGVCTHFSCANLSDTAYNFMQISRFCHALRFLMVAGLDFEIVHLANSAALMQGFARGTPDFAKEFEGKEFWVRPGLMLLGANPLDKDIACLKPVLSFQAKVVALRKIAKGEAVGYSATFRAKKEMWVATIGAGYGDGVPMGLSNCGQAIVSGIKVPFVGRVSMNLSALDVSEVVKKKGIDFCSLGQSATLIGSEGNAEILASDWAKKCNKITYEVFCGLNPEIERFVCP